MNEKNNKTESILRQLAELESLPTEELRARWNVFYGQEPPRFNRQFLIKRLAYRIQEIAYGGLDEVTRGRMESLLDDEGYDEMGRKVLKPARRATERAIVPGTVLVREWQGERHEIIAMEDGGFEYRGMPYRSLSAVARKITGTNWNGPAFWGLRGKSVNISEAGHDER
jgi:hypothetical protein